MILSTAIQYVYDACGANGYTPVGANARALLEDACDHVTSNSAPAGEEDLWVEANRAALMLENWFAKRDAAVGGG